MLSHFMQVRLLSNRLLLNSFWARSDTKNISIPGAYYLPLYFQVLGFSGISLHAHLRPVHLADDPWNTATAAGVRCVSDQPTTPSHYL